MNNFIFENATKTYFGKGCVGEYLTCLSNHYGKTVMLAYGGGSIKKNGIYEEVMECLKKAGKQVVEFSGIMANPTYAKVLEGAKLAREKEVDLILGVGGGSVMDCCKAISMAAVYDGDLWEDFWATAGVVDFEPLPLGVIVTVAGTGSEMNGGAVLHPVYYRHIYKDGLSKFQKFAMNVWGISSEGKEEEELARQGVEALADFIKEIGLPTTLRELGVKESVDLKVIADSCNLAPGSYKKMTHEEILEIFNECF
ncbi:MAG: iron-containing alcohol dehydrogenase [Lachnospiraceae bacterium]